MAGFTSVGQCEWADFPTKVLEKHWPDVPRWRDIRTLTKEDFHARTGLGTVDAVSGGFPCQPFSQAGKRRGKEDDRYLWPEMLRVIREIRPAWVVGENVAGIVNMALDTVLFDLENEGYTVQAFIIPAASIDAPHKRDRVAIVAHTNSGGPRRQCASENGERTPFCEFGQSGCDMAHANGERQQGSEQRGTPDPRGKTEPHRPTCQPGETLAYPDGASGASTMSTRRRRAGFSNGNGDVPNPDNGGGVVRRVRELQPTES
ncbi:MAG: DNA cytosine methyltransferase, partial [Clostridiales bacterium]|nr:DNA cytosine methyltransferase [Clostridiales bacterium]